MFFLTSTVIPIEKVLVPSEIDLREVAGKAAQHPGQFLLELAALSMMMVGLFYSIGPVYEFFKTLGRTLVQTIV